MPSTSPSPFRALLTGGLVVVLALLTACGASGDETDDEASGTGVVAEMSDALGEQESVRMTLGTQESPEDITLHTTLGEERTFRAIAGADPASQLDVRLVDGRVYVGGELVGHQWTYLDVDDPRLTEGDNDFDGGIVTDLLDIDVVEDLRRLEDSVTAVESKGETEIDGVEAAHHVLTTDTTAWLESLPETSIFQQMDLPETVEMDLYLDDDDLPVRLSYQASDTPGESAEVGFAGWGSPVEVATPKRAEPVG